MKQYQVEWDAHTTNTVLLICSRAQIRKFARHSSSAKSQQLAKQEQLVKQERALARTTQDPVCLDPFSGKKVPFDPEMEFSFDDENELVLEELEEFLAVETLEAEAGKSSSSSFEPLPVTTTTVMDVVPESLGLF